MLIHDIIKIRFLDAGYLPLLYRYDVTTEGTVSKIAVSSVISKYPYHLISDAEMCEAFISSDLTKTNGYFYDNYPCLTTSLSTQYAQLVASIRYHINLLLTTSDNSYVLPNWIYSYMLGEVVSTCSEYIEIQGLNNSLGISAAIDDTFSITSSIQCYQTSKAWLLKTHVADTITFGGVLTDTRPPTMFGEPHVMKSIRINGVSPN